MPQPSDRLYTKEHEWVLVSGQAATIGITDYAQSSLGDIVYVELPKPGSAVEKTKPLGVIESVKAVSDVYAPVSGVITDVNGAVEDDPAMVNRDPYGEGWLVKVKLADAKQVDGLMSATAYDELLAAQAQGA